ncbi:hypothetical protein [Microbacterium sp. WCS2018Hpa-23]|uniref:hypothetical protein n=1 Tax=Microbacterium sp. WCS2018Hpa-23 TaxID=3073634 RepID=UPI002882E59F|nr:hypothetical protein [Microbacterium sp. WCS2018Hpa-23]
MHSAGAAAGVDASAQYMHSAGAAVLRASTPAPRTCSLCAELFPHMTRADADIRML